MISFVLLEGMGAYSLLLLAPVKGLGGPLGGGGIITYISLQNEVQKVETICIFQTSGTMSICLIYFTKTEI